MTAQYSSSMLKHLESISTAFQCYPSPPKSLAYGTAGFRDKANLPLHSVFIRMGILAAIRSVSKDSKPVGIMITASHNPECDNGIKLVDFDGGMLSQEWEPYAEELANAKDVDELMGAINKIILTENITESAFDTPAIVLFGRDTRPHSEELSDCARVGIEACGGFAFDMGEVSTPQLHFYVQQLSTKSYDQCRNLNISEVHQEYHATLATGFRLLQRTNPFDSTVVSSDEMSIIIDASCGIGSEAVRGTLEAINMSSQFSGAPALLADVRNVARSGPVNEGCGAELVQKGQRPPAGVDKDRDMDKLMCSFDGDADRIVFHAFLSLSNDPGIESGDMKRQKASDGTVVELNTFPSFQWTLFDGDKIAALVALLLSQELTAANLSDSFKLGVVQTAYANGASTLFFRKNGIPVVFAKTGVKYLHHKAQEYDLGVYFEANGHGTVLLSAAFLAAVTAYDFGPAPEDGTAVSREVVAMHRLKVTFCSEGLMSK